MFKATRLPTPRWPARLLALSQRWTMEPGRWSHLGQPVLLALNGPRDAVFSVPEVGARATRGLWSAKVDAVEVRAWGTDRWVIATIREMAAAADPSAAPSWSRPMWGA